MVLSQEVISMQKVTRKQEVTWKVHITNSVLYFTGYKLQRSCLKPALDTMGASYTPDATCILGMSHVTN